MELTAKRILVIGANGVLGAAIARILHSHGAQVIGTARDAGSSVRLAPDLEERLLLDLEDDASIAAVTSYLGAHGVDGIVNAAGLVGFGSPLDTDSRGADRLMRVNHQGPARVISDLLPALISSGANGRDPFVASITGVVAERAFPGMSAYVASKTAHSAWLSALRLDLRRAGVHVLDAHPGHTETGLAARAAFGTAPRFPTGLSPEHVAAVIVTGLLNNATELGSTAFAQ